MNRRIYKSSIFDRFIYSLTAAEIILLSLWAMLYGIDKRSYNWPMIPIGAFVCSYIIYLLQKIFTYSAELKEECIVINNGDAVVSIKYEDILKLYEKGSACYIIDSVEIDGIKKVRGTNIAAHEDLKLEEIMVDTDEVPVLQKAFIENYDELIDMLFEKCNVSRDVKKRAGRGKDKFVRTAALKKDTGLRDILNIIFPYAILAIILLMGLIVFGAARKGKLSPVMIVFVNLIFPVFVVLSLFVLVLKYISYIKSLMRNEAVKAGISGRDTIVFLVSSIIMSAGIIIAFFLVLGEIKM